VILWFFLHFLLNIILVSQKKQFASGRGLLPQKPLQVQAADPHHKQVQSQVQKIIVDEIERRLSYLSFG